MADDSPSPGGEGRDEGELKTNFQFFRKRFNKIIVLVVAGKRVSRSKKTFSFFAGHFSRTFH
jgi:hypothetical protein